MNSAISYLRLHCSPIVNRIFFFYSVGPTFFSSLSFSFPFPVSPFLCSLSPSARRLCLPLRQNPGQSIKPTYSLISFSFFYSLNALSLLYLSLSCLTSFFSLLSLCFAEVVRRWVCSANDCAPTMVVGHGSWSDVLRRFCGSEFMGLGLWVWVHGSGFVGLHWWIIDVTGMDRWLDRSHWRGSSTWSTWVSDRCGGRRNYGG